MEELGGEQKKQISTIFLHLTVFLSNKKGRAIYPLRTF